MTYFKFKAPIHASNRTYHYCIHPVFICKSIDGEDIVTVRLADGGFQYTAMSNLKEIKVKK